MTEYSEWLSDRPTDTDPEYVRGHVAGYEQCKADHGIPDEPQPDWWACAHNPPCTLLSQCDYNPTNQAAQARVLPESPRDAATSAEGAEDHAHSWACETCPVGPLDQNGILAVLGTVDWRGAAKMNRRIIELEDQLRAAESVVAAIRDLAAEWEQRGMEPGAVYQSGNAVFWTCGSALRAALEEKCGCTCHHPVRAALEEPQP